MEHKEVKELLKKYLAGTCSPEEKQRIESWYADQSEKRDEKIFQYDREKIKEELWVDIVKNKSAGKRKIRLRQATIAAAAVVLLGLFLYIFKEPILHPQHNVVQAENSPVLPGGNKAILTTGGKQYVLSDMADGVVEQGDHFRVVKQEDGVVSFDVIEQSSSAVPVLNTIETPKGGIYRVTLPDGSKVWLNNASSISFPSSFEAHQRVVHIRGEVYFEVAHDGSRPFKVLTPQQEIEVLGTKFNINAYEEEPFVRTTLIQGSVKVKGQSSTQILKPGYEMISAKDGQDKIARADMSSVMAWKEGIFRFERVRLDVLMRQLARWYDIDLVYQGALPKDEFVGQIRRSEHIDKVLEVLQDGNVDIVLEGRKLIVGQKK